MFRVRVVLNTQDSPPRSTTSLLLPQRLLLLITYYHDYDDYDDHDDYNYDDHDYDLVLLAYEKSPQLRLLRRR